MKKTIAAILCLLQLSFLFACGAPAQDAQTDEETEVIWQEGSELELPADSMEVPLAAAPVPTTLMPEASGVKVYSNQNAAVDASHLDDGYIMVKYTGTSTAAKKVIVTGPSKVRYTYDLNSNGSCEVFPLSDGSGKYTVGIYQNVSGTKYSTVYLTFLDVALKNEYAPFLLPNQYVNYTADSAVVKKAAELTAGETDTLKKIDKIYTYVIKNISYDTEKAKSVQSGYLPDVDAILSSGKGICFDYAAVMTAMLRSQGIPTKLVVGYSGKAYHAWINTWSEESGWVEGVIYFDGTTWKLMDPTYASSGNSSKAIMKYIGDGANYTAKYLY